MNIERAARTVKNPPEQFAGDVWAEIIVAPHDADQRTTIARVRFAPGARTAWRSHARGQYLHVTAGVARFGTRDGKVLEVHPGQTLYTPPGEEHWHAAAPDSFMEHLTVMEGADDPAASAVWAEHITEEQYSSGG